MPVRVLVTQYDTDGNTHKSKARMDINTQGRAGDQMGRAGKRMSDTEWTHTDGEE